MPAWLRGSTAVAALALLFAAAPAKAGPQLDIGLGASYWFERTGIFDVNLDVHGHVAKHMELGGRFGALIATPSQLGVPLDFQFRVNINRAYLEAVAGPWIFFGDSFPFAPVRAHAGFGFGLHAGWVNLGLEVGWLQPAPIASFRLAFPL